MNKTLLNFTATALLSTLLTHPCLVVAMGKKGHTSIVIEDHVQGFTQMTPRDRLNLTERDRVQDMRAGARAVLGPPEQLDAEDRQELDELLKDKADGAAEDQQALARLPKERRLLQPEGASGQTYTVDWNNKGPKVAGYDYQAVPSVDEDTWGWKKKACVGTLVVGGILLLIVAPTVLCTTGVICGAGGGIVTMGMPAFEPPLWGPNVPFVPSNDVGHDGNGDIKNSESTIEDSGFEEEKPSGAPSDGDAGEDDSKVDVGVSSEKPSGSDVEPSTEDPTFGTSTPDAPEWVKNAVTSAEDSGFEEESSSSSSAGDTTAQESTKTTTTTTTTTTSTTTTEPTTTTTTTVTPIVTEPRSGYKPYDEVWVEYCDQNINWQPMQDEMQYWIWHHEQQAQTYYALNDCSAQYTDDGAFFLSVPDHYVYVCYPDGSSFFHYPQNNVWIPVHPY